MVWPRKDEKGKVPQKDLKLNGDTSQLLSLNGAYVWG